MKELCKSHGRELLDSLEPGTTFIIYYVDEERCEECNKKEEL